MWLLDVNLPTALSRLLRDLGVECDTTIARGWRHLTNGDLVRVAAEHGFQVLLTRDREFGQSAGGTLAEFPDFAVVVVTITQSRETIFLDAFATRWREHAITPSPGAVTEWP